MTTTPRDLFGLSGKVIAEKFRVDQVLGEGGYGVVYAGTHLLLGVPVAIKCLKPAAFTPEEQQRTAEAFLSEARILFGLAHPAIVRMYDAGIHAESGVPYVVLERLTGITISDEIAARAAAKKPFDKDELAAIFAPILEGVGFAHERGIIHRDLKPPNMMLVTDGGRTVPKVLDFGTARATETARERDIATATTTHATAASFTPLYAAPEQWDRHLGAFGARTDVYALGLTIAEACLLAYPLDTRHGLVSVVKSALDDRSRPLISEARNDLPIELERVIHKAMRVRPADRYPDAREMLASFRAALRVTTTTAPLARPVAARPSVPHPSQRPSSASGPVSPVYVPAHSIQQHATTTQPQTFPPPAPIPQRSSAVPWIIATLAVFVAVGTLIAVFVMLRLDAKEVETTTVTSPSGATADPTTDPPPPLANEKKDASSGRPRVIFGGTMQQQTSWTVAQILTVAEAHKQELDACVAKDPDAVAADMTLSIMVGRDGQVRNVICNGKSRSTCPCLQKVASSFKYPPPVNAPEMSMIIHLLQVVP